VSRGRDGVSAAAPREKDGERYEKSHATNEQTKRVHGVIHSDAATVAIPRGCALPATSSDVLPRRRRARTVGPSFSPSVLVGIRSRNPARDETPDRRVTDDVKLHRAIFPDSALPMVQSTSGLAVPPRLKADSTSDSPTVRLDRRSRRAERACSGFFALHAGVSP
jgi:hypothetical protein